MSRTLATAIRTVLLTLIRVLWELFLILLFGLPEHKHKRSH